LKQLRYKVEQRVGGLRGRQAFAQMRKLEASQQPSERRNRHGAGARLLGLGDWTLSSVQRRLARWHGSAAGVTTDRLAVRTWKHLALHRRLERRLLQRAALTDDVPRRLLHGAR